MKTAFLTLFLAFTFHFSFGQVNAGSVPSGATLETFNYSFSLPQDNMQDTAFLDLNCDNDPDILLILDSGFPAADGPRTVSVHTPNPSYSTCVYTSGQTQSQFYLLNDPMTCTGLYEWDSTYAFLSIWGGWVPMGPFSMTDVYISYQHGNDQGWIKLSYDLSALPITMDVTEAISYCGVNGIEDETTLLDAVLFPNPNADGVLQIQSDKQITGYEIVNMLGQVITTSEGNFTQISLPEDTGVYFVRLTAQNGKTAVHKIIRE